MGVSSFLSWSELHSFLGLGQREKLKGVHSCWTSSNSETNIISMASTPKMLQWQGYAAYIQDFQRPPVHMVGHCR